MASDFDKIFSKAQERHDAENHAADLERKRKDGKVKEQAQTVKSIAPSYLRGLGIQASRQLLDLKIPLYRRTWQEQARGLFGGKKYKTVYSDELWDICGMHLTKEGYFLRDYKLPGHIGFAKFVEGIRILAPDDRGLDPTGGRVGGSEVYVDARTKRICISFYPDPGDHIKSYGLGEHVADNIFYLVDLVARGEKVNFFA